MSYTVLARKHRPQRFDDLVGQEHVSRTLTNAIKSDRVAHAFLFTGPRGVGKTTTARLLAKALNCVKGPSPEPCNECDPCREITAGNDLDVLEIDGASNNSVDDVRRLQESLPYRPARDRFKIVIVDEVHMLSSGAFNAFLKTLEEPPAHVKFIFATTEMHKVPITIRSRCQRHDFRLFPQDVIATRLRALLAEEGIDADEAGVSLVAREAAGSMRDALTVLEQLLAFGGGKLVGADVALGLGIADRAAVMQVAEALLDGEPARCVEVVDRLGNEGLDLLHFVRQLVQITRDLVVLRVVGDGAPGIELSTDEHAWARKTAAAHDGPHLERTFAGLSKLVDEVAQTAQPQLVLEMGLVRLADRPPLEPLSELVARLEALESGSAGGGATRARSLREAEDPPPLASRGTPPAKREEMSSFASRGTPPAKREEMSSFASRATQDPPPLASRGTPPASGGRSSTAGSSRQEAGRSDSAPPVKPAPGVVRPRRDADDETIQASPEWRTLLEALRESQPALGAVLEHGVPLEVSTARVRLGFPEGSFFGKQAGSNPAKAAILDAARRVLGAEPVVEIVTDTGVAGASIAAQKEAHREGERARARQEALDHPRVRDAIDVFPGTEKTLRVEVER